MKRRSFLLPIVIVLVLISGIFFLVYSVSADPYERAVNKGDKFMEKMKYYDAISQYSIAQQLNANKNEAYIKNIMALAKNNDKAVVRDILTNVNDCIDYCGESSISPEYIADICDILVSQENGTAAFDILNHIHYKLASEPVIINKLNELSKYASESSLIVKPDISDTNNTQKINNDADDADDNDSNKDSSDNSSDNGNTSTPQPQQNQNPDTTSQSRNTAQTRPTGSNSESSVSPTPKATAKPQPTPKSEEEKTPVHTQEPSPSSLPSASPPSSDTDSDDSANPDDSNT